LSLNNKFNTHNSTDQAELSKIQQDLQVEKEKIDLEVSKNLEKNTSILNNIV